MLPLFLQNYPNSIFSINLINKHVLNYFFFRYSLNNLRFGKINVGRYPKEGERFRINTHPMSKQLPSISIFRNGIQENRRPAVGSNQRIIPFAFTEVGKLIRYYSLSGIFLIFLGFLRWKKLIFISHSPLLDITFNFSNMLINLLKFK